jgi:prenyltransferase beta subunit
VGALTNSHDNRFTRRDLLKSLAFASASIALPRVSQSDEYAPANVAGASVFAYLESLARPDGGYGWDDQEQSHLTPTYAVIGCYHLLNRKPPNAEKLAQFIKTHHPEQLKKLEQEHRVFEFQQVQSLVWLGADANELIPKIKARVKPLEYMKAYERHGYPVFKSEVGAFTCRALLKLPLDDLNKDYVPYLEARRRDNGSFNNTPAADGGDGNILNTLWGLEALRVLNREREKRNETVRWLHDCQLNNGAFTHAPQPEFAGVDDVAYTRAGLAALKLLNAEPRQKQKCLVYLQSLANADGGFGDRPGWQSNPLATYYALDALNALGALETLEKLPRRAPRSRTALPDNLKVWSIQLEAHGMGSPQEAVDLAGALNIHLWGAKNAKPQWINRAQKLADAQKVPVQFFVSNEEYGTWVDVTGLGTYSHTSDIMAPANRPIGAPLSNKGAVSWPAFREQRLAPLRKAGGHLVWQFGENEELTRLYLDDSLARGGYAAISTFHFGNPDFLNSEPFLQRWRGQIPFVALQDAHGNEPWWFAGMTTGFRTVFLATEPTWEGWLNALKQNWVVAIRHDAVSDFKTWMHGPSREVTEFVKAREEQWNWWENENIGRPLISIVPVRPGDEFETARPETGLTLRVRCARENNGQGLPKTPLVELKSFFVDGAPVQPEWSEIKNERGVLTDAYHHLHFLEIAAGRHTATAVVLHLETNEEITHSIEFVV